MAQELRSTKKKPEVIHDNVHIYHDCALGKLRTQAHYASNDTALNMKMDKHVRSQMKHNAEERVFFSNKSSTKEIDLYQQKRPLSRSRVRHTSKSNHQIHPLTKSSPRMCM